MKDIIIDCFKTIKQNYIVFMLAVVAFATLNMCEFSAMLDYLTYPTISLVLYMTLMKKKKISWKTLAIYFAFYAGSYLLYDLTLDVFTYIVPRICILPAFYIPSLDFMSNMSKPLWFILYIFISIFYMARIRLIIPFILSEKKYSIKELFQKSQIKYINLLLVVLVLYTPSIELYISNEIIRAIIFGLKISSICIFNFCFYKSRETPKERSNS